MSNVYDNTFKSSPVSIISLVPSITELLYDLGLEKEITGITKFCVRPQHFISTKPIIGGTKNINTEKILEISPELVIASKEENIKYQIDKISDKLPVLLTDVVTYEDAIQMIEDIGILTERKHKGEELIQKIETSFTKYDFSLQRKHY